MRKVIARFVRMFALSIKVRRQRLTVEERILLYDRTSLFLRSGIPLSRALGFIAETAVRKDARASFQRVIVGILDGSSLAGSMRLSSAFPAFECALVGLGEAGGTLPDVLGHLSVLLRRRRELNRTIVHALLYPALIACGTVLVSGFLIFFAFPKIVPLFKSLQVPLPATTRFLIFLSEFLSTSWDLLLTTVAATVVGVLGALRAPSVRRRAAAVLLALPLLGRLVRCYCIALASRILALLLSSGIPLLQALSLTAQGFWHPKYRRALEAAAADVRDGRTLADGLARAPQLFPPALAQLVAAGEATGTLSRSVETAADLFERELEEKIRTLTSLIEPLLMIGMGMVVGFIAIAIIAPIYGITQNLGSH